MARLTPHDVVTLFLSLGVLLAGARLLGELARRYNQPIVLGEILAGVVLGPTVLGAISPRILHALFPAEGAPALCMDGLTTLAIALFLVVAGMEVDLSTMWRQGRSAISVGVAGILLPFGLGLVLAWYLPMMLGATAESNRLIFALFFATALSISALPVIARTLMDLNIYRSDLGMVVIAAAVFNDLVGWIIFAVILGLLGTGPGHAWSIKQTIVLTLLFSGLMLTVVRWAVHRVLPFVQAHTGWPGGVLGFALSLALLSAAFTEWIGVHAVFGAFLAGVAIGDSVHLREHTRTIISRFISFFFAPLFFASIGLRANFVAGFDARLVAMVLVIACVGKIVGCGLGARLSGMRGCEAWATGLGMNARGAMEIILGILALQHKVIDERMFVALVVMAIVTSLISGPAMQWLLGLKRPHRLTDYLGTLVNPLTATDRRAAIRELAQAAAEEANLDATAVDAAVWNRERLMPTGMGSGVAVPHARIQEIVSPLIVVGLSKTGVDFDAPDGEASHLVFLILTPREDNGAQIEILADIARSFASQEIRDSALNVANLTELLALLKTDAKLAAAAEATGGA
jgi:Kef-type K+ transport system membrane component KefB/mannitol/fructose-specific phosphotransferase system IIA component (Ntr-type)